MLVYWLVGSVTWVVYNSMLLLELLFIKLSCSNKFLNKKFLFSDRFVAAQNKFVEVGSIRS